jgi:hypothetical protein
MVRSSLLRDGLTVSDVRDFVCQAPFRHFKQVFDAGDLLETPISFHPVPDCLGTVAGRAAVLALHGTLTTETVSYGSENDGSLFVNLVTMPGQGVVAEKSKSAMRGHTDGVSFPFRDEDDSQNSRIAPSPDLVTLVGLRNPDGVATTLMPLYAVLARMGQDDIGELKKAQYSVGSQKTFVLGMKKILGKELVVIDTPVLKDVDGGTYVRYSHSKVVASDVGGAAEQAAENFELACSQVATSIVIEPGDVLVVNNRLALHGRGQVGGDVGGRSRWILRTYGLDTAGLESHKRHLGAYPDHVLYP